MSDMTTDTELRNFALGLPNIISPAIVASQGDIKREREFHARVAAAQRETADPGIAERVAARRAARNADRKI